MQLIEINLFPKHKFGFIYDIWRFPHMIKIVKVPYFHYPDNKI